MENNNRPNDGDLPASDRDASSSKTVVLRKSTDYVQGERTKSSHVNSNPAVMEERLISKEAVHRSNQIPTAKKTKKGNNIEDGVPENKRCRGMQERVTSKEEVHRNNQTSEANKTQRENKKEDGTTENQRGQGMIDCLVGATYQQKLLIVLLCHVAKLIQKDKQLDFEITSEDQKGGIFDDIGVRFKTGDRWRQLFIQAKHKAEKTKAITWDDLTSTDKRAPFAISKYLNSFLQEKWDVANEPPVLVLCTNIELSEEVKTSVAEYPFGRNIIDSILESIANVAHQIDPKANSRICDYLRENSELNNLATQLAQHIHNNTTVDFRNPLVQKYRNVIENNIATENCKKKECYKVNESFFDEKDSKDFKKVFEQEYQKLLNGNIHSVWEDIRNKGIRFKKGKPSDKCVLPKAHQLPKQLNDTKIEKFFGSFILLSKTNHEMHEVIASSLENKLLPVEIQGNVSSEIVYAQFAQQILEWMQKKHGEPLKKRDILDMFKYVTSLLRFSQLKGMSNLYCDEMRISRLQCKPDIVKQKRLYEALESWLSEEKNEENFFTVKIQHCNNLPLIFAALELLKCDYIFLKAELFKKKTIGDILDVFFVMKFSLIIVIDYKQASDVIDMVEWLSENKSLENRKMILLMDPSNTSLDPDEDLLIGDLTEESRKLIFDQNMMLSGINIPMKELFHDRESFNIFLNVKNIPDGSGVKSNINEQNYAKIKKLYIPRRLKICDMKFAHEISSDVFWSHRWDDSNELPKDALHKMPIEDFLKHKGSHTLEYNNFVHDENHEHIDPPVLETNMSENASIDRGEQYSYRVGKDNSSPIEQRDDDKSESKVHVILNEAGFGKTFYMTWLARELQKWYPSWWVIKFNLNEYSTDFDQFEKDKLKGDPRLNTIRQLFQLIFLAFVTSNKFQLGTDEKREQAQVIAQLLSFSGRLIELDEMKIQQLTTEQFVLLKIFANKFNSKELVILMDGFDEVTPYYKAVVLKLLKVLETFQGIRKIYLSSRPYDFRTELQATFENCSFYRLVEFNSDDQCSYVHRFLLANFKGYESCGSIDQDQTFQVTAMLLNVFLGNFMEVPLFLNIALELLLPIINKHINLASKSISPKIMKDCEQQFAPMNMIESFIEKKVKISKIEKTGANITISQTAAIKVDIEVTIERLKNTFSRLALFTVLSESESKQLLSDKDQKDAVSYMDKIRNGSEKSGIIEGIVNNVPLFIHRLFAEYFVAFWFFSNQTKGNVKSFLKKHVYESHSRQQIRFFLDSMVCKESQIHMAILDNSISKVKELLNHNHELTNKKDAWGRTPLHLALAYGSKENGDIISLLLKWTNETAINFKDTYFDWSALDYAHIQDQLNGTGVYFELYFVLQLIIKGASINSDETFTRFIADDPVDMFARALPFIFHLYHELVPSIGKLRVDNIVNNFVKKSLTEINFDFYKEIPTHNMYEMVKSYNADLAKMYETRKFHQGTLPLLQLCTIADSKIFEIVFNNFVDDELLCRKTPELIQLAYEFRSVNVLQYLIINVGFKSPEIMNFEQELLNLLVHMQEDECMFKSNFHLYCNRHQIVCLEESKLPPIDEVETSHTAEKRISLQGELWRCFPAKLESRDDLSIDSGTEFILSRALETNNKSVVEYLLQKTKAIVNNRFIKSIVQNCAVDWCCQPSFHFFIECSSDLRNADEHGQTLLHFAVEQAQFGLVKCLIDDKQFNTTDQNPVEKNWNAFFYCVSDHSEKFEARKNIFTYIYNTTNPTYDCLSELDTTGKSVFYYAVKFNKMISDLIIKYKFSTQLKYFKTPQIVRLVALLKKAGLNAEEMLEYLSNIYLEEAMLCKKISNALQKNEMLTYTDRVNRNLLHISVRNNWFLLVKCLIENFNFDVTESNKEEMNWNSFYYCVADNKSASVAIQKSIFIYLLRQHAMNCFDQVDLEGKSVFWYATKNNDEIGEEIFKRQCELTANLPIEERIRDLMGKLQNSNLYACGRLVYLEENNVIDEKSVKIICDYMKTTGDLNWIDEIHGCNLLHVAILHGWLILTKCLIEHYGFDVMEINEKEKNWNAFFYCVSNANKPTEKLNIFTYLMEKYQMDCFNQLDSEGKSVFWYATSNNEEIGMKIFKRQCESTENLPIEERIRDLMGKLQNSNLNANGKFCYLEENNVIDEESVKSICDYMKTTGDLDWRGGTYGRNLLHITIREGWLVLTKCLIEHYGFDVMEINEKDDNWNAFFYCVCNANKPTEKLNIFTYLMEKYQMDCFNQLDSEGKSVFWYATSNNEGIGMKIFKRQCELTENLPIEERIRDLMGKLEKTKRNAYGRLCYLEENNVIDEKSVKSICDYMRTTGDLDWRGGTYGRNLLHITIREGWLVLTKCLIEHYGFDVMEINEKDDNWNAFFYCVSNANKPTEKLNIFTYLMEKYPMDCFNQLDSEGKSVFWYATSNNEGIGMKIFKRQCESTENLPIEERIRDLMGKLQNTTRNAYEKLCYLEENNVIEEKSVKSICDYMKTTGDLSYKSKAVGQNLLHVAIRNGWLILTKCLIEHYGFDVMEVNEKDDNWNPFFYCVGDEEKPTEKLNIFTYLMKKYPMDCFNQLDSKGKSVFWYATSYNRDIGLKIFKRRCKLTENLPIEERIRDLMGKLQNTTRNAYEKLCYLEENNVIDEKSVRSICDYMKTTGDLSYKSKAVGRNLLHVAIRNGWLILTKCLIEHYGFDVMEVNEKDDNWNAFFYCVGDEEKPTEKLNIFTYLMEKYPMDCFNQLDSEGKSVFWYATRNNSDAGMKIFKRQCELKENLPIEERIRDLMGKLENSTLNAYGRLCYLEENNVIDEKSVKSICDYMRTTGDLDWRCDTYGRNLLHLAIREGWLILTKCLIEHYGFDVMEINEKEKKWNAFFYCVSNANKPTEKLNIFTYLMERFPMDCFNHLDSEGKSVFWYATRNNSDAGMKIFKRQCELKENLPIEERIRDLMGKLENSTLNAYGRLCYLEENNVIDEKSVKSICDYMRTTGDLDWRCDTYGRNLLHLAIREGWLILTKCLIEHYGFDVMEINEKEKKWNAFFYCVSNANKPTEKLNIFTYLMERFPMDCFNHLDSEGKSVFWYATRNNSDAGMKIFKRQCELKENLPIEERIRDLMGKLQTTSQSAYEKLCYLEENNVIDEKSVKSICDYMQKTGDLSYKEVETGRELLQIAIDEGWWMMVTCLVDHFGFVTSVKNENETK